MKYGQRPAFLGTHIVECNEMMFYQYLPIKFIGSTTPIYEDRLKCFDGLVGAICCDFIGSFGLDRYVSSYVYLTAKYMYQVPGCSFNRSGYHSDGFMTDDINYIWSDNRGTIYNSSKFVLDQNDESSLIQMAQQADPILDYQLPIGALARLNQYVIHKVDDKAPPGMRTFLKLSFTKDKYDLIGNSHNYLLNYDWEMKPRKSERNIPQSFIQPFST